MRHFPAKRSVRLAKRQVHFDCSCHDYVTECQHCSTNETVGRLISVTPPRPFADVRLAGLICRQLAGYRIVSGLRDAFLEFVDPAELFIKPAPRG